MSRAYAFTKFMGPSLEFGRLHDGAISGTVKDSIGNPLERDLLLYYEAEFDATALTAKTPYRTTTSSVVDGTYSFAIHDAGFNDYVVVCIGLPPEPTLMISRVKAL